MGSNYVDNLIDDDAIPELTKGRSDQMLPLSQLHADLQHTLMATQQGNVTFVPDEEKVPVPVSQPVVERFRVSGSGWEGRVDEALREWLDGHPVATLTTLKE